MHVSFSDHRLVVHLIIPSTEFVSCACEPDTPLQIHHSHRGNSAHETVFFDTFHGDRDATRCDAFLVGAAAPMPLGVNQQPAAISTHKTSFALFVSLWHQLLLLLLFYYY